MHITKHAVASLEYTLKDDEGAVIDSSSGGPPLAYVHGVGALVPGLEEELEGKTKDDELSVIVPPVKGYGERDERMVQTVERDQLPKDVEVEVGMRLQAQSDAGVHILTVTEIAGSEVKLDANHPLAGMNLNFDVKVVDVRAATAEEIEHGHVHGPDGGHHH